MNMSYIRFENTLKDLEDCANHLFDDLDSHSEQRARARLIELCRDIVAEMEDYEDVEEVKETA